MTSATAKAAARSAPPFSAEARRLAGRGLVVFVAIG